MVILLEGTHIFPTPAPAVTTDLTLAKGVSVYAYGTLVKLPVAVMLFLPPPKSLARFNFRSKKNQVETVG